METERHESLSSLGEKLETTWYKRLDRDASRPLAHEACHAIRRAIDPLHDYRPAVVVAEFLWDTEEDLFNARVFVTTWRKRVAELTADWSDRDALAPRVNALLLEARLYLRANEYATARKWVDAAARLIRQQAGGDGALRNSVKTGTPTGNLDLYTSLLAVQIPILRLDRADWPTTVQLLDLSISDAIKIIETCPPFERLPQLIRQALFAVADRGDSGDRRTLQWLAEEDSINRPTTARAECTYELVTMVLARERGDVAGELRAATAAEQALRRAGLKRQIRALNARGWWKLRPAA